MKKLSGLSGIIWRVLGRSMTPSTMISDTWMPAGHSERAMDSARLRCAAFAGANAADLGPPRRDAVAPMNTIEPVLAAFMSGITCRAHSSAPYAFTRHDCSNCSGVMLSTSAALGKMSPGLLSKTRPHELQDWAQYSWRDHCGSRAQGR